MPTASFIDGGTLEWLRGGGYDLVPSADLFQASATAWDDAAIASHQSACTLVAAIKDGAFDLVRQAIAAGARIVKAARTPRARNPVKRPRHP